VALLGALLALSAALSVAESMLGALLPLPVPGVKLGLANIISLFLLRYFSLRATLAVGVLRTLLSALFVGGIGMFVYAAPGAVLSILAMYAAMRHIKPLSLTGISVIGACVHNLAQVCVAVAVTAETGLFYYAFVLLIVGAVSGTITGAVARMTFPRAAAVLNLPQRRQVMEV
jgi:heptaprenyl diphosphate synthase